MTPSIFRYSTIIVALLFSRIAASEECITVAFVGVDADLQRAAYQQLVTELNVPVHIDNGPATCWQLSIELNDAASRILLSHQKTYNTTIQLNEFDSTLWPRAIALSASGLWILAHEQPQTSTQWQSDMPKHMTAPDAAQPLPGAKIDAGKSDRSMRKIRANRHNRIQTRTGNTQYRVQFLTTTGVRMRPSTSSGIFDFSAGMSVLVTRLRFDLSLVGVFGRKSFNEGQIFTTGAGLRAALFWQTRTRKKYVLGIGPAVETLGIFGYGHSNEGFNAHQGFSPVVNMFLMGGGWLRVSPKVTGHIALGGGYSLVHFDQQLDNRTVAGFNGASINGLLGVSFGATPE